jgi:hypothetical protein
MPSFPCLAAALVAGAAFLSHQVQAQGPKTQCSEGTGCYFRININETYAVIYDLCGVCNPSGYTFSTGTMTYSVNIGAAMDPSVGGSYCAPDGYNVFSSYGMAVQNFTEPPEGKTCTDSNGATVPCTGACAVLTGLGAPIADVLDPSAPSKGVLLSFPWAVSSADDPFACPYNPKTGASTLRSATYAVQCNPAVDSLTIVGVEEPKSCGYAFAMESSSGCGQLIPRSSAIATA